VIKSTTPVIYKIRNVVNQKFYVGSTINMKERTRGHRSRLRNNRHHSPHLQAAWNKYGEDCFKFEVVEEVASVDELQTTEDRWLTEHVGQPYCYNTSKFSDAPWRGVPKELHPSFGSIVSDDEKLRISSALKAYYAEDPDNHPRVGTEHTDETKAKISAKVQQAVVEGRGGKFIPSEETRKRMSQALKGNQNAKGHVRSEEHRRKLAEAVTGNQNWLGRTHTEETKAKLSKRVLETTTGTKFPSLSAVLAHYGLKMPTLRRALVSGRPLSKGPHQGLAFRYLDDPLPPTSKP